MNGKPLAETPGLEWLRYMNACNAKRGKTPLEPADIAQLFAYIQSLEQRLKGAGADISALRNSIGLGVGHEGKGFRSRRRVRAELARLEKEHQRERLRDQRAGWRGKLPFYTARFERTQGAYVATVDEMPGVFGQGQTFPAALRSLTGAVELAVDTRPVRPRRSVAARRRR